MPDQSISSQTRRKALERMALAGAAGILCNARSSIETLPLEIAGQPCALTVTAVSAHTARITVQQLLDGQARPVPSDGALVKDTWGDPALQVRSLPWRGLAECGRLQVRLSETPFALTVAGEKGQAIQSLQIDASNGNLNFSLGNGPLFGLGQGGPQFDRRGKFDAMKSGQAGYRLNTNGAKVPVPLLIGSDGWALFVRQPFGAFDLTGQRGVFKPAGADAALPLDLFVIGAQDPRTILAEYARLTGYPEMVPLWSLGYQQSHRTLGSPEEIIREAKIFREKKLPCDALIYLGTGFCPQGWNTDNGEFTWNSKMFPNPKQAIDELHAGHFKVVLHVVIEGEHLNGSVHDPCTAAPLPSGKTPDGNWPPDRQTSCYWPAHKPLFDLGVDGWWPDQGDGFDAHSRLTRNKMYFEGSQMYRPNERVYALHRNAYAGMQRYAAFLWSGDVQSTWETLKTHIAVGINAGLSGIPYWGTDIGGFVPTEEYTGELFARWFQFAAFNPLFRPHGRDWRLHLPWGWTVGEIGYPETRSYHPGQDVLHNPAIEPICKRYLELRYRLMPYLYSTVKQTCETGLPIIRALWLHDPNDPAAVARGDEYLYGESILVAPVFEKGASSRTLYLPRGSWYDFWTEERLNGKREINRKLDLATMPLYCHAGAIIPMGPIKQYTEEQSAAPITINIYPGADGRFALYEDDGKTFDFRKGEFSRTEILWNDRQRTLTIRLAEDGKSRGTLPRHFVVRVAGESGSHDIAFDGTEIQRALKQ